MFVAWLTAYLALMIARLLPKRSLAQVFVLVATALLAVGTARMLAVPVFLTLFMMGAVLALRDKDRSLSYTNLPDGHWLLAIVLFVVVGASLPWHDFTWLAGLQAIGLLLVRALAKIAALAWSGGSLPLSRGSWSESEFNPCRQQPYSWPMSWPVSIPKSDVRR